VIADVRMSGITGLELHRRLQALGVDLPTIIVTGHGDVPMAVTAFRDGVVDFIEKPLDDQYVLERIEFSLAKARDNARLRQQADDFARRYESLTQREKEVLEYIVAGKLNKQIADLMDISIKTVEVHRSRVMEKMQVTNVAELVRQKLSFSEGAKKKPA
jgi:FixJ family two-component response regulator